MFLAQNMLNEAGKQHFEKHWNTIANAVIGDRYEIYT
jgi:ketosteroid isomerase-like protein